MVRVVGQRDPLFIMQWPIKINRTKLPIWLHRLVPSSNDPRSIAVPDSDIETFEDCVSAIKINQTWKSTSKKRHVLTDQLIMDVLPSLRKNPTILEVGVSTGSTSLDLLDKLGCKQGRYYITDLYFSLPYQIQGDIAYFYHPTTKKCIMRVSDYTVMYEDSRGAVFPLGFFANHYLTNAPEYVHNLFPSASMLHPTLKQRAKANPDVVIKEYDIFTPWLCEPVDIIKVANVLNKSYFSEDEIVSALVNLKQALKPGGKLIITDNRELEMVSMLSKTNAGIFVLEQEVNRGSEVAGIACELPPKH